MKVKDNLFHLTLPKGPPPHFCLRPGLTQDSWGGEASTLPRGFLEKKATEAGSQLAPWTRATVTQDTPAEPGVGHQGALVTSWGGGGGVPWHLLASPASSGQDTTVPGVLGRQGGTERALPGFCSGGRTHP